uniref:BPTI/Kunitz inhibitor domain-containing protein n=1 Tax=Plectus sambesii TaxID=2011161 RepID=A0A914UM15_9BILA
MRRFSLYICFFLIILSFVAESIQFCEIGNRCTECEIEYYIGKPCVDRNSAAYSLLRCNDAIGVTEVDEQAYLLCDAQSKRLRMELCPTINGAPSYFDGKKGCYDPLGYRHHQAAIAGSGRVGDICVFNTDCLSGMYCSSGHCSCLSTFVPVDGYCYESTVLIFNLTLLPQLKYAMRTAGGVARLNVRILCLRVSYWVSDDAGNIGPPFMCPLPDGGGVLTLLNDVIQSLLPPNDFFLFPIQCNSKTTAVPATKRDYNGNNACVYTSANGNYNDLDQKVLDVSDIYDCIEWASFATLPTLQYGFDTNADGICCMSRAFACIQPKKGEEGGIEPRWWYNSIAGTCQQFLWNPATTDGSPNNFRTLDHCESYCRDTCIRGSPEYTTTAATPSAQSPIDGCASSTACSSSYDCTTIGSLQWCCLSTVELCSKEGGRPYDANSASRGTNYDLGVTFFTIDASGTNPPMPAPSSKRYYYDPTDGQCHDFTYAGLLGNFNNFMSTADCQNFCGRLQCDYGSPLQIGSTPQRCKSNSDCPLSHSCKTDKNVCCPTPQTVCTEPLRVGDCTDSVQRYWFNAATRACEVFDYTGCQGNDNRFKSLLDCQTFCKNINPEPNCPQGQAYRDSAGKYFQCAGSASSFVCPINYECYYDGFLYGCCPIQSYTCSLQSDSGVVCGAGSSFRYFFNPQTRECQNFQFLGCDGNSNNFPSLSDCEEYCGVGGCPNGGSPYRTPTGQTATCSASVSCPTTHECAIITSGTNAVNRCCPTKAYICALPPQTGTMCGSSTQLRYYFNIVTQQCTSFSYNGCNGNMNNFATLTECNDFCFSSGKNPSSQVPTQCTLSATVNVCPLGFTCQSDIPNAFQGYCCSVSPVCPNKANFYVDLTTKMPVPCAAGGFSQCPTGFTCQPQQGRPIAYCCAGTITGVSDGCPPNQYVYMNNGEIAACDPFNPPNSPCPSDYSCQWSLSNQRYQCCGSNPITLPTQSDGCPDSQVSLLDYNTKKPRLCTASAPNACPNGYFCQFSSVNAQFQCCGISAACRADQVSIAGICLDRSNPNQPCVNPAQCLGGSTCTNGVCLCPPSTFLAGNICKQGRAAGGGIGGGIGGGVGGCASNQIFVNGQCLNTAEIGQACVTTAQCLGQSQCISGFCECTPGQIVQDNVCIVGLPTQNVCDVGSQPFLMNGVPQICTGAGCPTGYSCQYSRSARNYYCCSVVGGIGGITGFGTNGCPSGNALLFPQNNLPVECDTGSRPCPNGYVCMPSTTLSGLYQCCSASTTSSKRLQQERRDVGTSNVTRSATPRPTTTLKPDVVCPSYLVLVERVVNGRKTTRCETSCPSDEIPVRGICKKATYFDAEAIMND